jgi:hypothetical protein
MGFRAQTGDAGSSSGRMRLQSGNMVQSLDTLWLAPSHPSSDQFLCLGGFAPER